MAQPTDKRTIFVCDNCDAVIEDSAVAKTHYYNCTTRDSETEGMHGSSRSSPEIPENDQKELLITEVFCREPLWNTQLPYIERHYKTTSALWHEVDTVLGVPDGYSQKTFKTLRDRFVRLLGEEAKSKRSGSAASNTVEWKYFSQLDFLRPSVEYRPTINSLSKSSLSKSKRSIDVDASGSNSSASKKKYKNVQPAESVREDFESFCKKNIDPTVPDRIGSFILYLESEMRVLSKQAMKILIRKITESLMQVQDESAT